MEIIAAHAGKHGLPPEHIRAVLECVTCDEALRILRDNNVFGPTIRSIIEKIAFMLNQKAAPGTETGVILFSNVYGKLGATGNAAGLLKKIIGEETA